MIGSHKTTVSNENGIIVVNYHGTNVVIVSENQIRLNTGGYRTKTTKLRMNQSSEAFGLGFSVYQSGTNNGVPRWFLETKNIRAEIFGDTVLIDRNTAKPV